MKTLLQVSAIMAASFLLTTCQEPKNHPQQQTDVITPAAFNPTPSPDYLSPEESMNTFHLPEGYHLELVASEPMIKEPVAIAWDGNGKMYVAEMLTYMQDADATGEREPVSRISLLEDTDNDGKMDKSTVFIDKLLLPRMIQCIGDELFVNETNTITIHSYKDTDGDGKADEKKVVYENDNYDVRGANMEHQRSGLVWNLDNWMYLTYEPVRFRYTRGKMEVDSLVSGGNGQWGLAHDSYGRLFFSSAGGENPAYGFQINPVYGKLNFSDQFSEEFQEVWPIIATPDVQGGLGRLRPNVTLNHFTGACGQSVFRGDRLPQDLVGDYIIAEPVGRLIRRAKLINQNGKISMENAYDKQEFIASSDMNFRPVNTDTGPDGNLYIVDMHRGIIQQGNWTQPGSFLRHRIDSIGLAENVGHGRIYRVVHDGFERGPKPNMLNESSSTLVTYLDNPNGWWRDNAQKQIILNGDKSVVPTLQKMATGEKSLLDQLLFWKKEPSHLGRIHALWTLEGLDAMDKDILLAALKDENPQVRRTAVWISEPYLEKNDEQIMEAVSSLKNDESGDVRVQMLLSLYQNESDKAKALVSDILSANQENEMLASTEEALEKNESIRTFGARLGSLEKADRNLILNGTTIFTSLCATCHGDDGKGIVVGEKNQTAPPLVGSDRLAYTQKNTTIRILLDGLHGPVDGKTYMSEMPAMKANSDEWIASIVSYIRYEFGENDFRRRWRATPVVQPEEVKQVREETSARNKSWTLTELKNVSRKDEPEETD